MGETRSASPALLYSPTVGWNSDALAWAVAFYAIWLVTLVALGVLLRTTKSPSATATLWVCAVFQALVLARCAQVKLWPGVVIAALGLVTATVTWRRWHMRST